MKLLNDQEVCFLFYRKLYTGKIKSYEKRIKLYTVVDKYNREFYVNENYVYPIDAEFCIVVNEYSMEYPVRFDTTTYKCRNKLWIYWTNPDSWIKEEYDHISNKIKATVYGLEI